MLKVLKCKEKKPTSIEFNTYIPIYIEFGSWDISKEPTVYWRTGDFKKSLIEIGIGKNKGEIRSVALNLIEKVDILEDFDMEHKKIIEGIPVIESDQIVNETYLDEKSDLKVSIYKDQAIILFSENDIETIIQNGHVGFGLDANNDICSILTKGLEEDEKAMFLQY